MNGGLPNTAWPVLSPGILSALTPIGPILSRDPGTFRIQSAGLRVTPTGAARRMVVNCGAALR
jgi:hypothetical protein